MMHWVTRTCIILTILISLTLLNVSIGVDFPSDGQNYHLTKVAARGKDEVRKLQRMIESSRLPQDQGCWRSALETLHVSCKDLTQDRQSRLAFTFTTCFTQMTGMGTYICEESTDIKDCFRAFDPAIINIYHAYFLHSQDMCFFLQQQVWQEQTAQTVNQLTSAADEVVRSMMDSHETQARILESQKESVKVQSNLLKDNNVLYSKIVGFKEVFEEFRNSANEHRVIFFEMFEKLTRMQKLVSWIQGEMSFFDMLGFYFLCLIFGFVSTSTTRTHQARFWLVVLFVISIASEKSAFTYFSDPQKAYSPEDVQSYIWLVRKLSVGVGIFLVLIAAARYRDYNVLNNNMLSDLHTRFDALVQIIEDFSKSGAKLKLPLPPTVKALEGQESKDKQVENALDTSSTSSDSSLNYDRDSESEEDNLGDQTTLVDDSLKWETQLDPGTKPSYTSILQRLFPSCRNNKENTKLCVDGDDSFESLETVDSTFNPILSSTNGHRYFLRERRTPVENQIVKTETPTEFVKKLKQSRRASQSFYQAERALALSYFSSDDEF